MFSLILATDNKGGIGKSGLLPWHNRFDLIHFKRKTKGQVIIMGRKTWESLPTRPLPNRVNIVLSRTMESSSTIKVCDCLNECILFLEENYPEKEWFIIGGGNLYNQIFKMELLIRKVYLTQVNHDFECDTKVNLNCLRHRKGIPVESIEESLNQSNEYDWTYREYNFE